jgi:hypothetical protein
MRASNSKFLRTLFFCSILIASLFTSISNSYANITYSFLTGGATGLNGPTQTMLNTAYSTTTLSGAVTDTSGIQSWTVPYTGQYVITAIGAGGGAGAAGPVGSLTTYNGGKGASMQGTFSLTANQTIQIIVGQVGVTGTNALNGYGDGGGGGGSYVYATATATFPLIVAGGGGGAGGGTASTTNTGLDAAITTQGTNGNGDTSGTTASQTAGSGGYLGSNSSQSGSAGAGWLSNGAVYTGDSCSGQATAALAPRNGGLGGYSNTLLANGTAFDAGILQGNGGFGGGGAGNGACYTAGAGGGGGYSGGGGGSAERGGGGGGSYNSGTSQTNTASVNSGDGSVTIIFQGQGPVPLPVSLTYSGSSFQFSHSSNLVITATLTGSDGTVTFYYNNKKMFHCVGISSSSSIATCSWKPSAHGLVVITAYVSPTSSSYLANTSAPMYLNITSRTVSRGT